MRLFAVKWPETLRNGRVLTREDLPIALRQPSWFEEDAIAARPFEAIQRGCGGFRSLLVSQESRCHAENLVVILQNLVNFAFYVKENVLRRAAHPANEREEILLFLPAGCVRLSFELQEAHANSEPPRLGGLRRSFVHPGIRSNLPLQGGGRLYGFERRARGQTSRRRGLELRRHFALERRRHDADPLRTGGSARSGEDSELFPGFTHAYQHAAGEERRAGLRRAAYLGTESPDLHYNCVWGQDRVCAEADDVGRALGSKIQGQAFALGRSLVGLHGGAGAWVR